MRAILLYLCLIPALFFGGCSGAPATDQKVSVVSPRELFESWERIQEPFSGPLRVIGGYSGGCLVGASALEHSGDGFHVMRLSRRRFFGHPSVLGLIRDLGKRARKKFGRSILVGDVSRPTGGPTISGHVSHQTGLDADIWLLTSEKRPGKTERQAWNAPDRVAGMRVIGWRPEYTWIIREAAAHPESDRVFVNAAIKKALCRKFAGKDWLRKVRPWWGHSDHVHVRMKCPPGESSCRAQDAIPADEDHCGVSLDWWFSEEAREEQAKRQAEISDRPFPDLPEECRQLVNAAGGA